VLSLYLSLYLSAVLRRAGVVQRDDAAEEDGEPSAAPQTVLHHREAQSHEQADAQGGFSPASQPNQPCLNGITCCSLVSLNTSFPSHYHKE